MSVICIVLTGGPCGGKSSSLKCLRSSLEEEGYRVMSVPEVPTILMSNGAQFPGIDGPRVQLIEYESLLIKLQLSVEDSFKNFLCLNSMDNSLPGILICDRAALDVAAYLPEDIWKPLLKNLNTTQEELLGRYDIVCHLVTTANGAPEFYTSENNSVRTESPEEARTLDIRTRSCWSGHTCHKVFENIPLQGFAGKLKSITEFIRGELLARRTK